MEDGEKGDGKGEWEKKTVSKYEPCDEDEIEYLQQKRPCYFNPNSKCCCVGCWNLRRFAVSTGVNEIIFSSLDAIGYVYNFIVGAQKNSAISDEYRSTLYVTFIVIIISHLVAGIVIIIAAVKRIKTLCLIHCAIILSITVLYVVFITTILQNSEAVMKQVEKEKNMERESYYYSLAVKLYCGWCGVRMLLFLYDGMISLSLFTLFRAGIMFDGLPICGSYFAQCGKNGYPNYLKQLCARVLQDKKTKTKTKSRTMMKTNTNTDEEELPPAYEQDEQPATSSSSIQKNS